MNILRILMLFSVLTVPCWAALPPLSSEDRWEAAQEIVVARVVEVESQVRPVKGGFDRFYSATVEPIRWEKGEEPAESVPFKIHFHQTGFRPAGWAGPQGQNSVFLQGDTVRLFLRERSGRKELLVPNGWEAAQP